jgi:four helix bundle protein
MEKEKKFDIKERSLKFAVSVARFIDGLPKKQSAIEYGKQLMRSSASIGANLEEADGALSKKDFINKIGIARKESKESRYWLQLIKQVNKDII